MVKEVSSFDSNSIHQLLEDYALTPNQVNAMKLGKAIAIEEAPIEVKKWRFRMALDVLTPDKGVYATIKAWASITLLEDNIPSSMKIVTIKEMLNNPNLKPGVLDIVLKNIFERKELPRNLLNYLAPEFKRASKISDELKSYVLKKADKK
ncbi:MAG: hypothetical protein H7647_03540 [Candidatus Heimdallarchaeota archaeon]|nr:hypothetical protein [Candidatus Heimdallarchaeota archaeon]MCK4253500.1 hypothetical protein [Candidatus Heimdallarchaeota archaeon]